MIESPASVVAPIGLSLKLADRSDLSPRVLKTLKRLQLISAGAMERSLRAMLDEFELQLVRRADKALNNEQENAFFDTLHIVKRKRDDFNPRFLRSLESSMARFDQAEPFKTTAVKPALSLRSLELLGEDDLQNAIVLEDVATKAALRCSHELYALGYRFGVLAGSPRIDADLLPVGPAALAEALRVAAEPLDLTIDHRSLLYRAFERLVMSDVNALYQVLNRDLVAQRILPNLLALVPSKAVEGRRPPAVAAAAAAAAAAPRTVPPPEPPHSVGTVAAPVPGPSSTPRTRDKPSADEERTADTFQSLRNVLKRRRLPGVKWVSRAELHDILAKLQASGPSHAELRRLGQGNFEPIQLNELRDPSPRLHLKLTQEDEDILDLVGLLFEQLSLDAIDGGVTRPLLLKLHIPFARVALHDQDFFLRRAHPARLLLNGIVAGFRYGIDEVEGDVDFELSEQLRFIEERIVKEYDGNLDLIEELWLTLSKFLSAQARKYEVAERRHVAAASGRAKLNWATLQAREAIAKRLALRKPGKLLRTLFDRAWVDVLALTLLRHSEDSVPYRRRIAVVEELLALDQADRLEPFRLSADDLHIEIESGLEQVGYHHEDIPALVQKFLMPEEAAQEENPSSQTELAMKLKNRARLGADMTMAAAEALIIPAEPEVTDLGPAEEATVEKLGLLPPGAWLTISKGVQGVRARRRLWNFPTIGMCLLTNLRGAIVAEKTLKQLARAISRGDANISDISEDAPVEYAWAKVLETLSLGS